MAEPKRIGECMRALPVLREMDPAPKQQIAEADMAKALELYREGVSIESMCVRLGIDADTARLWVREAIRRSRR